METKLVPVVSVGLLLGTALLMWLQRRGKRRRSWRPVGSLTDIYLYPVKSGRYHRLEEAECTLRGLRSCQEGGRSGLRDRSFLVYDVEKMQFLPGKSYPKLLFINVKSKTEQIVTFLYPGKEDIDVVLPDKFDGKSIEMWAKERIRIVDCGPDIARWVSEIVLGETSGLGVGYWPEEETWRRNIMELRAKEMETFKNIRNEYTGSYADFAAYLIINKKSVEDLNSRINDDSKPEPLNFRPNLVIDTNEAFAEDEWNMIKIGEVEFINIRHCTRCSFTTINPETGISNPKIEPLKTLRTYRMMKMLGKEKVDPNYPAMGIYVGMISPGRIRIGDAVSVC